jgi:hypothetical protein
MIYKERRLVSTFFLILQKFEIGTVLACHALTLPYDTKPSNIYRPIYPYHQYAI